MAYEHANPVTVPPSGGCQPGVRQFEQWFQQWWGLPTLGCYNPASVTPGGSPSLHRDGRAADIGHDWTEQQIERVWQLCRRLTRHSERLGVQQIIYRGLFWRQGQAWLPVSAATDPHESHAHVEFLTAQSKTNTKHDYIETLGLPPMDQETIDKLAAAIVDKWYAKMIDVHDYDANADTEAPASSILSWMLAELSQIRNRLTGQA